MPDCKKYRFAIIGVAGYIAPRHLKAIADTGNELVAAYDPVDSVGILDEYFPECDFFTEFERFDRHIDKLRREGTPIDYITICSPNYLHDAHIRFGLKNGSHVICEKPLVLNSWNALALQQFELETNKKVYTILQLRHLPELIALKKEISTSTSIEPHNVSLIYITARGKWYDYSWKGDVEKSGGIATNIGIHFFDMLIWIFGDVIELTIIENSNHRTKGILKLEKALVNWELSIEYDDLPKDIKEKNLRTFRSINIDGKNLEFSDNFTQLHTSSYQNILNNNGFGIEDTIKSIELVSKFRN